jgi:uncharacterized membrane protein YqjE
VSTHDAPDTTDLRGTDVRGDAQERALREDIEGRSLGDLVGRLSGDFSRLVRLEIALAKGEAKDEAARAGKGAGLLGGAGVAANLALVFVSLTVMFALANVMDYAWAALIVTVVWAVVAAVLASVGRKALKSIQPPPETTETLKEDAQWVKTRHA